MRHRVWFLLGAMGLGALSFVGCGDGEEKGGGGVGGSTGGVGGTGGTGGTGGDSGSQCAASFVSPTNGQKLTVADDKDQDCSNGFVIDVEVSTDAPSGTNVVLRADGTQVGTGTVSGGKATITDVTLDPNAATTLEASVAGAQPCSSSISVTVDCAGLPTCEVTLPSITPTHPKLNAVPTAQGGDRSSADGTPYQTPFDVTSSADVVELYVDSAAIGLVASVAGGVASFPGVTLVPDGEHKAYAKCKKNGGPSAQSAEKTYTVDTVAPDLTVGLADGAHFGPADDADSTKPGLQIKVCGSTTSADALDLPASLGAGQANFGVAVGTSTPTSEPATTAGASGACVILDCPGGAPFDLSVSLKDEAGNPTTKVVQGVTCTSTTPSVQIVDPVDGTGANIDTHILAATATSLRKDQDASAAGAQYTVRACTDQSSGVAKLFVGTKGGALVQKGADVTAFAAATSADGCPSGLGHVVSFANATLDESVHDATFNLTTATELRVDVTASGETGKSPLVDVWVDSVAPSLTIQNPVDLCGKLYTSTVPITQNVNLFTQLVPVTLTVTPQSGTGTSYQGTVLVSGNLTQVPSVVFPVGVSTVTAAVSEPSGNTGALPGTCQVTVGNPPLVSWVTPTATSKLNAVAGNPTADADGSTPGWQGTLKVQTDLAGNPNCPCQVTFSLNGTPLSAGTVTIDGTGAATLTNVTIPDSATNVQLKAETNNVAGKGVGTATITIPVDTVVPSAPTGLSASVKARRQTTFHLDWTAPADGPKAADGYKIRVSKAAITSQALFDAATDVPFTGTPAAAGAADGIDVVDQLIETDYYFAVAAFDNAGNQGVFVSTAVAAKASFNSIVLENPDGMANQDGFGFAVDGFASVNGDQYSDLVAGTVNGGATFIYFGGTSGYATTPSVRINGTSNDFGWSVAAIGDIDHDGKEDIAVGAPFDGVTGRVYIYKGRDTWPATLSLPDYVIEPQIASNSKWSGAQLGWAVARLGDFDNDGNDDFAIGAPRYGAGVGAVVIIRGVAAGQTFPASVKLGGPVTKDDFGTFAIGIEGDSSLASGGNWFGENVLGAGQLYAGGGKSLVVAAAGPNANRLYAFKGQAAASGFIAVTTADAVHGTAGGGRIGTALKLAGVWASGPALTAGEPAYTGSATQRAHIFAGGANNPFSSTAHATFTNSAATNSFDSFGYMALGSGFSGTAVVGNFINGALGDVVFGGITEATGKPKIYFVSAEKAATLAGTSADIVAAADIALPTPAALTAGGASPYSSAIKDMNGDGFGDIAIGETNAFANNPGRVWVLW
ncbi:MAG: FG-GAP repeat protein [Myxococcales bacterium]|nr:FG-GAP repeat protein [Myxococcales bacterium]